MPQVIERQTRPGKPALLHMTDGSSIEEQVYVATLNRGKALEAWESVEFIDGNFRNCTANNLRIVGQKPRKRVRGREFTMDCPACGKPFVIKIFRIRAGFKRKQKKFVCSSRCSRKGEKMPNFGDYSKKPQYIELLKLNPDIELSEAAKILNMSETRIRDYRKELGLSHQKIKEKKRKLAEILDRGGKINVAETAKQIGIHERTLYAWRKKYNEQRSEA